MMTKLPTWVWFGGGVLAMIGGMVNSVGFLGITHEAVTHLTGTTTLGAIAFSRGDWPLLAHLTGVLLAYFSGSVASGYIIQQSTLQLGHRYGVTLFLESVMLFLAAWLLMQGLRSGEYLATAACGVQNGMASSYSGAVVRTTHLSGIITDLGIWVGHSMRGLKLDTKRARLNVILVTGFFAGAVMGAMLFSRFSYYALFVPAAFTGGCGTAYSFYKLLRKKS